MVKMWFSENNLKLKPSDLYDFFTSFTFINTFTGINFKMSSYKY